MEAAFSQTLFSFTKVARLRKIDVGPELIYRVQHFICERAILISATFGIPKTDGKDGAILAD